MSTHTSRFKQTRFEAHSGSLLMKAVVTMGSGDFDMLSYCDVPMPVLDKGEILIKVGAAGVNNTDINTRLGWYSSSVTSGTNTSSEGAQKEESDDGGWNGKSMFPFIQGTDCCGMVSATFSKSDAHLIGKRVIVRPCVRPDGFSSPNNTWIGSNSDGAFAEYIKVPATEAFPVVCDWSDAELATLPCSYGTAENMLHRANLRDGEHVLITGASGGVGSAAVQLAKRRGAIVTAVTTADKAELVKSIGADIIIDRGDAPESSFTEESVNVVVDNVAGPNFGNMIRILKRGGRYVSSGAIAGPMVTLDMRDFYLKDLNLIGCTGWDEPVFGNIVSYIERGEIKPLLAKSYPLKNIADAQRYFIRKEHFGNLALTLPQTES